MTTVSTAMKDNHHKAIRGLAVVLSLIVYLAGLAYAGVRSYSLFVATIDAALLPLAVIGYCDIGDNRNRFAAGDSLLDTAWGTTDGRDGLLSR